MSPVVEQATHAGVARLICVAVGSGAESIGQTLDPITRKKQPRSVFTIERTGRRFKIEVTQLPDDDGERLP